jgi:hypothetical protein
MGEMKRLLGMLLPVFLVAGCASTPPRQQEDLCAVFDQHSEWYGYAKGSEETWGTPKHILMAFIKHESSYRDNAKPPYDWFLFIPLGRKSSAKGYAQIQDPVWKEYKKERGGFFKSRADMEDALDFIGWYNDKTHERLGVSKWDAKRLYLAYHEGHGGYRRGSYKKKPEVVRVANKVSKTASNYGAQLRRCADQFECQRWYEVWPLCG